MPTRRNDGLISFSPQRRMVLSAMLRSGLSIAAATALSGLAIAREGRRELLGDTFDYIIVGGGSAGCVMADRLSAVGFRTLLLETGTNDIEQPKLSDSALWFDNLGTETDWQLPMVPQQALESRSLIANAGRVLGGSGSINAMFWLRPDYRDLASLSRHLGSHWSPENIYRAVQRAERFVTNNSASRSLDGRMMVGRYSPLNPLSDATISAAATVGIRYKDHNASRQIDGIGYADVNAEPSGRRSGPAQTYIAEALARDNFHMLTSAQVTRLLVDGNICQGVDCFIGDKRHRFYASGEVVLSAGALGSPKLLMLSGLGPSTELKKIGIEVKHHIPAVGLNLQDHIIVTGISYRGGPLYQDDETIGKVATHAFCSTDETALPPNIQITCMQTPFPPPTIPDGHGFTILPWVAKVKSRGQLQLRSSDYRDTLIVDPAYLSRSEDLDVLVQALDIAVSLGNSAALQPFIDSPLFSVDALRSKGDKVRFIRKNASPGIHFMSTCSAGTNPKYSVVDPFLRVWGIDKLRIVDGSVLPEVPGVNPQVTIIAIAERAAEMMLNSRQTFRSMSPIDPMESFAMS